MRAAAKLFLTFVIPLPLTSFCDEAAAAMLRLRQAPVCFMVRKCGWRQVMRGHVHDRCRQCFESAMRSALCREQWEDKMKQPAPDQLKTVTLSDGTIAAIRKARGPATSSLV